MNDVNPECDHAGEVDIAPDNFYQDFGGGVRRAVPGDCICAKCLAPIPVRWNNGKPEAIKE